MRRAVASALLALGCTSAKDAQDAGSDAGVDETTAHEAGPESTPIVTTCTVPPVPPASDVNLAVDVIYEPSTGQALDVAWPKTGGLHPLIVWIHGGGWWQGDKTVSRPWVLQLASIGYAVATLNYQLVPDDGGANTFPTQIGDVRCALKFLRAQSATYAIDPARVVAMGGSAGAHLGALMATASEDTKLDTTCASSAQSAEVSAAVVFYGTFDLRSSAGLGSDLDRATKMLGGSPESDPVRAAEASPIAHIDAKDPPFLLLYGLADPLFPQSDWMRDALQAAGVPASVVALPGVGHAFTPFSPDPTLLPATCTALAFLKARLPP